jgi:hypothetical protein
MNSLEKREGVGGRGENQKELINCWEFKKCGRQPDGEMVDTKGPMWRESRRYICSYDQRLLYMRFLPAREKGVRT